MFVGPEATTQGDRKQCGFLYMDIDALNSFKIISVNQIDSCLTAGPRCCIK